MTDESPLTSQWLTRAGGGDAQALAALFEHYRPRLRQMVRLRLDARLASRLDPSDVVQEVYLDLAGQLRAYLDEPRVAFYVWLRGLAWERLLKLHRRHLGAACRAIGREQQLPAESSAALARQLLAGGTSPSGALVRKELRRHVQEALARLAPDDCEVILLRDFEGLSNNEAAQALGLSASGATMRYGRAMVRLKALLMTDDPDKGPQP